MGRPRKRPPTILTGFPFPCRDVAGSSAYVRARRPHAGVVFQCGRMVFLASASHEVSNCRAGYYRVQRYRGL